MQVVLEAAKPPGQIPGCRDNCGDPRVDMRDETTEPDPKTASERQAKIIYPPSDEDALKAMCIYLNNNEKNSKRHCIYSQTGNSR